MLLRRYAALCLLALLAFPAAASAEPFKDRVIKRTTARAAQVQGTTQSYPTTDGTLIPVTLAASYTGDPAVAQTYATYLGTLPHGSELASLRVIVVPSTEIASACGGDDDSGILACYGANDRTMIVPGDQPAGSGVSVNYVIAHESGHHIAANRSNAPLAALDFGPKRWSSYELVCKNTIDGRLAPGDEDSNYLSNPGEAWAEAYARLVFPAEGWRFTPLLQPTQGSTLAAMADVTQPWAKRVSRPSRAPGRARSGSRSRSTAPSRCSSPGPRERTTTSSSSRAARPSNARPRAPRRTASTTGSRAATTAPRTAHHGRAALRQRPVHADGEVRRLVSRRAPRAFAARPRSAADRRRRR